MRVISINLKTVLRSFLVGAALIIVCDMSTTSLVPFALALLYGILYKRSGSYGKNRRNEVYIVLISIFFSICVILGKLERVLKYSNKYVLVLSFIISSVGCYYLIKLIVTGILELLVNNGCILHKVRYTFSRKIFAVAVLGFVLISWVFSFLVEYPGIYGPDSGKQLAQALGNIPLDVLFPIFSTLLLRGVWNIAYAIWKDPNAGVAVYLILQMIVMGIIVTYCIYRLYCSNVKKWVLAAVILFYAWMPFNMHMSHALMKDTSMAFWALFLVQLLWEYYEFGLPTQNIKRYAKYFILICTGVCFGISKTNAYYAFLFFIPFGLIIFWKKLRKISYILVITLVALLLVNGPLTDIIIEKNNAIVGNSEVPAFDIRYKSMQKNKLDLAEQNINGGQESSDDLDQLPESESKVSGASNAYGQTGLLIIPTQQLGRLIVDRNLSEEEYGKLSEIVEIDEIRDSYEKHHIKNTGRCLKECNMKEFFSIWAEFGLKYPYTYLIAWRDHTYGYWYPDIQYGLWPRSDFEFETNVSGVYADPVFGSKVDEQLYDLELKAWLNVPGYGLLCSPGFCVWLVLFASILIIIKKGLPYVGIIMPIIAVWLTLLVATPVYAEWRYIYSLFLSIPLLYCIPFINGDNKIERK